jgi:hypothetical protein
MSHMPESTCQVKNNSLAGPAKVSPSFSQPVSMREALLDRHEREAGGGGRKDSAALFMSADERCSSDGQAVWFRRPDRGAKSAVLPSNATLVAVRRRW